MKIIIDPGHGGKFPGAYANYNNRDVFEKDLNMQIANKLFLELRQLHPAWPVLCTRTGDFELGDSLGNDLDRRCEIQKVNHGEVFVSLHCNSVDDPRANGYEVIFHSKSLEGMRLASLIADELKPLGKKPRSGGFRQDDRNLYILAHTSCPAVVIEPEFMSYPKGLEWLIDPSGQEAIAKCITRALERFEEKPFEEAANEVG